MPSRRPRRGRWPTRRAVAKLHANIAPPAAGARLSAQPAPHRLQRGRDLPALPRARRLSAAVAASSSTRRLAHAQRGLVERIARRAADLGGERARRVFTGSSASSSRSTRSPSTPSSAAAGSGCSTSANSPRVRSRLAANQPGRSAAATVAISSNCLVSSRPTVTRRSPRHGQRARQRLDAMRRLEQHHAARLVGQRSTAASRSPALLGRKPREHEGAAVVAGADQPGRAEQGGHAAGARQGQHAMAGVAHRGHQPRARVADAGRAGVADIGDALALRQPRDHRLRGLALVVLVQRPAAARRAGRCHRRAAGSACGACPRRRPHRPSAAHAGRAA